VARQTALPAPPRTASSALSKPVRVQASLEMARPRLELGTPRFSGTGNRHRKSQKSPANRRVADRAYSASIPVDCRSCLRLKDVAGPPRPFCLLRSTAAWGSKASATPAPARAAPPRPMQEPERLPSTRSHPRECTSDEIGHDDLSPRRDATARGVECALSLQTAAGQRTTTVRWRPMKPPLTVANCGSSVSTST
jgi:hypothetical protein